MTSWRSIGKKLCVRTVVNAFSRFSPVVDPRYAYRGEDVVRTLDETCKRVGYPKTIRVDQGAEFISRDLDLWAYQNDVTLDFSRPGKPTYNAFTESSNGKFRADYLNAHGFLTLDDARKKMEDLRRDYNEVRQQSVIGDLPPITLINRDSASGPPSLKTAKNPSQRGARFGRASTPAKNPPSGEGKLASGAMSGS